MIQNTIGQIIQIFHSASELIFLFFIFLFLHVFFKILPCIVNAKILWILFKSILSEKMSTSLWGSDVLLFSEFINIVSILFYMFIEFILLLYTFLVISFARYRFHLADFQMYYLLLLAQFVFTCAIGSIWSIYLGVNNLSLLPRFALYLALDKNEE